QAPGRENARGRPGGRALPRPAAGNLVGRPGRPAAGQGNHPQPGRRPRRAEGPPPGSAQQHGAAGPRGVGPAPLRAAELGRDRPGPGEHGGGGQQALPPCLETAQDDPQQPARRPGGVAAMSEANSELDPVAALAGEFAERYRRGERPSLSEYTARYPQLAEQIRDLFPALVVMEELGSVEGPRTGSATRTPAGKGKVP